MDVSRETRPVSIEQFLNWFWDSFSKTSTPLAGLPAPFLGFFLLSSLKKSSPLILAVFDQTSAAEELYRICYNLSPGSVFYFPEETDSVGDVPGFALEYERYRSESVNSLNTKTAGLFITTKIGGSAPVISKKTPIHPGFYLKNNVTIDRSYLINSLTDWGYEKVDKTINPKTFSTRGGILDVFLLYSRYPIRIEFFGDRVDSLRLFNPHSQRMIEIIREVEILPPVLKQEHNTISLFEKTRDTARQFYIESEDKTYTLLSDKNLKSPTNVNQSFIFDNVHLSDVIEQPPQKTFIFIESERHIEKLLDAFPHRFTPVLGSMESGFHLKKQGVCFLSFSDVLGGTSSLKTRWDIESPGISGHLPFSTIEDLDWGDPLVHQDFGIGLYRGLEIIRNKNERQECIKIEYADGGAVYVPVEKFNRIHKLILTGESSYQLSSLGSTKWSRQKKRVKESAKTIVQDLVASFNNRSRPRGFVYDKNDSLFSALIASFPYDETPDQTRSISDVIKDMEKDQPMDRLICGDVGFGKTEVALRATMKAVISGKKVLFLTPTTLLADQHYISSKERLEPVGVRVGLLSRFKTRREQLEILEQMALGTVDLVVGTHRLLSDDVRFPELGLLIIDEEHRFGVRHKEILKKLRNRVDTLTLTATPIPRTLQQSLVGIKDVSRINTAPKTRKPIHTLVKYFNWTIIKQTIQRELSRNGQVYFLHNDIDSIPFVLNKLLTLFPHNLIKVAHGRMRSKELESAVLSFFAGRVDILLCTTIVESGLDVSNANTIIINNAQNFGLSQLYQIRGRVGRSHRQAYCLLLIPSGKSIEGPAFQRLKALEQNTSLGSGYYIALKDLEIRGAGNLFGYQQSGHIAKVGFEMYCKLLKEVADEASEKTTDTASQPKITIAGKALLEHTYVRFVEDRLYFYQMLSEAKNIQQIDDVYEELRDRFGRLPRPAENLIAVSRLRILFTGSSVRSLHIHNKSLTISLGSFKPFNSFEDMANSLDTALHNTGTPYHFVPGNTGDFQILVSIRNFQNALDTANLFVKLFSV